MNKAYKFRLYPNQEQEILLSKTFGCVRFIYNKMLADKIEHYERTKEKLNNTPASYKKAFEWLKEVDSLALANAQLHLQTAYNNFFRSPKVGFPKFKSKHKSRASYTTNNQKGSVRIEGSFIKLPKLGLVKFKQHRAFMKNGQLKSATISKTPTGKYFISILFEYKNAVLPVKPNNVLGLDFSMKTLFVTSNGESANYPRYYRRSLEQLKKASRKLSKRQKGSQNRIKQRLKVAKIHEKISNQRKDFLHKTSRKIANSYDAVCVEDLNMKAMSQALHFGKSVSDNGFGLFLNQLAYKLLEQGKQLVKIDKWFPSSKMCSSCHEVKETLLLSERMYQCAHCGLELDRDINAALNIRNQGQLLLT